jgi:CRP-like cAMP-binding protein
MVGRFLKRLDRYGPPDAAEHLAFREALTAPRALQADEPIARQFASPRESTLLLAGRVGRVVTLASGAQQITALQVPSDFVDLHAFVLSPLDHSVECLTDCVVTTVAHADLRRLTDAHPRLARALWHMTLVDAAIHRLWLTMIGRRDALQRTAHLLCELYVRLEDVGLARDGELELGLSQAEVADVLCLSAVHVNRVSQELRARGLASWGRRQVLLTDWSGLRALAQFDPTYLHLETTREP